METGGFRDEKLVRSNGKIGAIGMVYNFGLLR